MKGYMYILLCNDDSYYTGSTTDLERRLEQHFAGEGANHTKKHPPVKLLYYEEFDRIDDAFYREKQVQGWSRKKKEALINGQHDKLPELSRNYTQYGETVVSTSSTTETTSSTTETTSSTTETTSSTTETTSSTTETTSSTTETTSSTTETTSSTTDGTVPEPVEGTDITTNNNIKSL